MKYALNHPWHFSSYWIAAMTGGAQVTIVLFFGVTSVIALVKSPNIEYVIIRFVGLAVIANIDDYFYNALAERESKEFISKYFNEVELCESDDFDRERDFDDEEENQNSELSCHVFLPIQVTTSV